MTKVVALFNPKSKTLHDPRGGCGHISWQSATYRVLSWKSAVGRAVRRDGRVCGSCRHKYGFTVPPLVGK